MSAKYECASGASCDDKPGVGERGFSRFGIWMTFKFIMTATRRFMQTTSQCPVVGKRDVIGFFPVACHSRGFPTGSKRIGRPTPTAQCLENSSRSLVYSCTATRSLARYLPVNE